MQFGQTNMGSHMMNNNNSNNMGNMINQNRNLSDMNVRITSSPTSNNIAGINKIPQFNREDRFKNVKIDRNPAKQIMNSAGQNMIQNKIRGVGDISAK